MQLRSSNSFHVRRKIKSAQELSTWKASMLSNKLGRYKVDFFKLKTNYTFRIHCFYCLYAPYNEMLLLFSPDGSTYNFQAFSSYHNTNNWYGKYYRSINTSTVSQLLHKSNTIFPFHCFNRNRDNFWYSKRYVYLVTFCCLKRSVQTSDCFLASVFKIKIK